MFSLAISTGGFGAAALALVPFDLSPNYSGPVNAVVHTCYSIAALIAPFIVGIITPHVHFFVHLFTTTNCFANFSSHTRLGIFIRMAFYLVVRIYCIRIINSNILGLGFSENSTVEFSEETKPKCLRFVRAKKVVMNSRLNSREN